MLYPLGTLKNLPWQNTEQYNHEILFSNTMVIFKSPCFWEWVVREAVESNLGEHILNQDGGLLSNSAWSLALNLLAV